MTLKQIHSLSEPIRHLTIYEEHELVTPEVIDTRVMNGVLNNTNKRNQWRVVE